MHREDRYRRLKQFLGAEAMDCLRRRTVLIVGCGALGSATASYLVRAGVGKMRIVDFDVVQDTNLGDQCLFTHSHCQELTPKVLAAAQQLKTFNREVSIEPIEAMFDRFNALEYAAGVDLVVDCVDNLDTKYLLNDVSIATLTPWVYGGCVGAHGTVLAVVPGHTPCLRCVWREAPPMVSSSTCSSVGILPMTPCFVAALQATEVLKILTGRLDELSPGPLFVDLWQGTIRSLWIAEFQRVPNDCPACGLRRFDFLEGTMEVGTSLFSPMYGM